MSAWGNVDWYILAAAWMVTGVGALLGLWAIVGDRARGRRRCPRCWYDMSGATSLSCPECGRDARHERRLFRTRRRWRYAALAVFVILAGQSLRLWPGISRDGWLSPLPMWALMHALPITGMDGSVGVEFQRRLTGFRGNVFIQSPQPMTIEERAAIIRRCARGNVLARPVSERWQQSYGDLLKRHSGRLYWRLNDGRVVTSFQDGEESPVLTDAVGELMDLPPVLRRVYTRERWPEGMPVAIRFEVDQWWPTQCHDDVVVRWSADGGAISGERSGKLQFSFEIPATGLVELDLDIDIRQQDLAKEDRPRRVMSNQQRRLVYEVCDTIDDALPIARGEAFDQLLSSLLEAEYYLENRVLMISTDGLAGQELDEIAFGAELQLLHNGELIMVVMVRWLGGGQTGRTQGGGSRLRGLGLPWREATEYIREHNEQPGWEARLKSDAEWALNVLNGKRRWEGEVRIPTRFEQDSRRMYERPIVTPRQTAPAR